MYAHPFLSSLQLAPAYLPKGLPPKELTYSTTTRPATRFLLFQYGFI